MTNRSLKGKSIVITGASRGIGKAIALRAALDGAKIAIFAKTTKPHPKLEGTIYTAAEELKQVGASDVLPIGVDIRFEDKVKEAINQVVEKFGGIDILVNNASAINLQGTEDLPMKVYDLMQNINTRGTFLCSKLCIPYLKKSSNPHILTLSPPPSLNPKWYASNAAYTIAKMGMSMCALGMSEEFREDGIAVNCLWPRTAIATAAVRNLLGGDAAVAASRTVDIMSDAAYEILTSDSKVVTGNFFIDDDVMKKAKGYTRPLLDAKYAVIPGNLDLANDYFLDEEDEDSTSLEKLSKL